MSYAFWEQRTEVIAANINAGRDLESMAFVNPQMCDLQLRALLTTVRRWGCEAHSIRCVGTLHTLLSFWKNR